MFVFLRSSSDARGVPSRRRLGVVRRTGTSSVGGRLRGGASERLDPRPRMPERADSARVVFFVGSFVVRGVSRAAASQPGRYALDRRRVRRRRLRGARLAPRARRVGDAPRRRLEPRRGRRFVFAVVRDFFVFAPPPSRSGDASQRVRRVERRTELARSSSRTFAALLVRSLAKPRGTMFEVVLVVLRHRLAARPAARAVREPPRARLARLVQAHVRAPRRHRREPRVRRLVRVGGFADVRLRDARAARGRHGLDVRQAQLAVARGARAAHRLLERRRHLRLHAPARLGRVLRFLERVLTKSVFVPILVVRVTSRHDVSGFFCFARRFRLATFFVTKKLLLFLLRRVKRGVRAIDARLDDAPRRRRRRPSLVPVRFLVHYVRRRAFARSLKRLLALEEQVAPFAH